MNSSDDYVCQGGTILSYRPPRVDGSQNVEIEDSHHNVVSITANDFRECMLMAVSSLVGSLLNQLRVNSSIIDSKTPDA